jgi:hypothetical protein
MSICCIQQKLRRVAKRLLEAEYSYVNIPIYQEFIDQSDVENKDTTRGGPPALNNEPTEENEEGRLKRKQDIRRQGPRPGVRDPLLLNREDEGNPSNPDSVSPIENLQGVKTRMPDRSIMKNFDEEDLQKDTIGFDPDIDHTTKDNI